MTEVDEEWFETREPGQGRVRRVSRFLRKDFSVSREFVEQRWEVWTRDQKLSFAGAFSARAELSDVDHALLDFLMENGTAEVWMTVALSVGRHRDRNYAVRFLVARVKEGIAPLANYYQALEMLRDPQSVPALEEALAKHRTEVNQRPIIQSKADRFAYIDYLSCSATLFRITGRAEYLANIEKMLKSANETVRQMAQMVACSSEGG